MPKKRREEHIFEHIAVTDAGANGKAIAKAPDGRVIFLPNAVPGDVVDIRITKKRSAYYEGIALNFHQRSRERTLPVCEHFGVCGGCKWQHLDYQRQLFYKQKEVANNLARIGKIDLPEISPIIGAPEPYFYRNKLEFAFSNSRWLTREEVENKSPSHSTNALGFHIPGRWDKVLDIRTCHLQQEPSNAIREAIKKFAEKNQLGFFNPREPGGLLRLLTIRIASTGEIMVILQFFENDTSKRTALLNYLLKAFPQITSLQYVINQKPNDTIYDQEVICYAGRNYINEEMEGLRFRINAKSFYQTNSQQAHTLYKTIRHFAAPNGTEHLYDLYSGAGTIALFLARQVRKVTGVEAVPEAVSDAVENAQYNGISNVHFFAGDMKNLLNETFMGQHGKPDIIIADPPRDGMHPKVVEQLLQASPEKIIYVSCNSATQARDISLMAHLYKVTRVQPIDMFPQTHHVENVVLLEKNRTTPV